MPGSPIPQAGAIAYRRTQRGPEFLVVTARRDPTFWVFPKGHIEPGESAEQAAVRELREEAGVEGRLGPEVGSLAFRSGEEDVEVRYYLIEALGGGRPGEGRRLEWLPESGAARRLSHPDSRALLARAAAMIRSG